MSKKNKRDLNGVTSKENENTTKENVADNEKDEDENLPVPPVTDEEEKESEGNETGDDNEEDDTDKGSEDDIKRIKARSLTGFNYYREGLKFASTFNEYSVKEDILKSLKVDTWLEIVE